MKKYFFKVLISALVFAVIFTGVFTSNAYAKKADIGIRAEAEGQYGGYCKLKKKCIAGRGGELLVLRVYFHDVSKFGIPFEKLEGKYLKIAVSVKGKKKYRKTSKYLIGNYDQIYPGGPNYPSLNIKKLSRKEHGYAFFRIKISIEGTPCKNNVIKTKAKIERR